MMAQRAGLADTDNRNGGTRRAQSALLRERAALVNNAGKLAVVYSTSGRAGGPRIGDRVVRVD
jgi:hypothetical protein